jgi:hypothetical protein
MLSAAGNMGWDNEMEAGRDRPRFLRRHIFGKNSEIIFFGDGYLVGVTRLSRHLHEKDILGVMGFVKRVR